MGFSGGALPFYRRIYCHGSGMEVSSLQVCFMDRIFSLAKHLLNVYSIPGICCIHTRVFSCVPHNYLCVRVSCVCREELFPVNIMDTA
jgi:hypothetical protein